MLIHEVITPLPGWIHPTYTTLVLFKSQTSWGVIVQRTKVSERPSFVNVITRFIATRTCAGVHSAVVAVVVLAILSPWFYEQIFTGFHAQIMGRGHGVRWQGKWVANLIFSTSLFTPSMNFEAMAKFRPEIISSGLLPLLSSSMLSKNLPIDSSSLWRLFSNFTIAWCPAQPGPKRVSRVSRIFWALSRSFVLLVITQIRTVASKLLVSAIHSCFFEKFSSSMGNFITSIQVSLQPSIWIIFVRLRFVECPSRPFSSLSRLREFSNKRLKRTVQWFKR